MKVRVIFAACLLALGLGVDPSGARTSPVADGAIPTAEDFARLPAVDRPKISPNGQRIATLVDVKGQQYLTIVNLDGTPPQVMGIQDIDINRWYWVNDDWLVANVGAQVEWYGSTAYISRAIGIEASTGKFHFIGGKLFVGQNSGDVIWSAKDGSARVLLALQTSAYVDERGFWPQVVEVDLATGKEKAVVGSTEGVLDWVADNDGVVRLGYGTSLDGKSSRILYRKSAGDAFKTVDKATGSDTLIETPDIFLPDGKAVATGRDENGLMAVYDYDLEGLKRGAKLYSTPGYDIGGVLQDRMTGKLSGYEVDDHTSYIRWIDPDMIALQKLIDQQVQGGHADIVSVDAKHDRAILLISSADAPGAYFLYDRASGNMGMLGQINPALGLHKYAPVKSIRYKARDGVEIEAILTLPKGKSTNLPLIVLPHGGPAARDFEDWDFWVQYLASRGYAVIQPNYRGSTGYGRAFQKLGEGQWGEKMQDDLIDAITYLAGQGIADDKRVCIAGGSYGGYAAMRAAQRDASHYRCAIAYAGVSDLNGMIRYNSNFLFSDAKKSWLKTQAPDLRGVSPINSPEKTAIPMLIVHGKKDDVVPFDQGKSLADKLTKLGKPVTFIAQPLADHHFSRAEDRLEFLKAMQAFLDKYNPS